MTHFSLISFICSIHPLFALFSNVQGYWHQCTIPANGMNLVIFDLVNTVMALIIISALITLAWYLRILVPWGSYGWISNTKWVKREEESYLDFPD